MPAVVVIHRLKNFDAWFTQFKANPPPKVGRWRVMRGADDRNRAHVVGTGGSGGAGGQGVPRLAAHAGRVPGRQRHVDGAGRGRLAGRGVSETRGGAAVVN
jgi:hypothetical protein